jgi:hypothetical protein
MPSEFSIGLGTSGSGIVWPKSAAAVTRAQKHELFLIALLSSGGLETEQVLGGADQQASTGYND